MISDLSSGSGDSSGFEGEGMAWANWTSRSNTNDESETSSERPAGEGRAQEVPGKIKHPNKIGRTRIPERIFMGKSPQQFLFQFEGAFSFSFLTRPLYEDCVIILLNWVR